MTELRQTIQDTIDRLVRSGAETGLQVAVYSRGEPVVDAVAGVADSATGRPFTPDTPVYSTSTGKGLTSAVVHVLVDRGLLDYDTRVVELWPEYGAHGKEATTVRHVLTHTAGVPGLPADITPADLCDWDRMATAVADAVPWWEPGTRMGYHSQSYGYLVGEIVRRVTGRTISSVVHSEIAVPLGIADELFLGVPRSELGRLARLEEAPADPDEAAGDPDEAAGDAGKDADAGDGADFDLSQLPFFRVVHGYTAGPMAAMPSAEFGNREDVLTSDIPAGGTFTARAIARVYAALLDEVDGVRLISPPRRAAVSEVAYRGYDEVIGSVQERSLGYSVGPGPSRFGTAGSGGSAAFADTAEHLVVAVTKNRCDWGGFDTVERIAEAVGLGPTAVPG